MQQVADASRSHAYFCGVHVQPLLRGLKPLQARHFRVQIEVLPLGVKANGLQFVDAAEQVLNKPSYSPVTVRLVPANCR